MTLTEVTTVEQLVSGTKVLFTARRIEPVMRVVMERVEGVILRVPKYPDLFYVCTGYARLDGGHPDVAKAAGTRFAWALSRSTYGAGVTRYLATAGIFGMRIRTYAENHT